MKVKNLEKVYTTKDESVIALTNFSYEFYKGKFYAISGHSGSGKTTLLKILGLMDEPTNGEYSLCNKDILNLSFDEKANFRMKKIGFIFQDYRLDPNLRAYENVVLPMLINPEIKRGNRENKSNDLLDLVGMLERRNHFPKNLSGGEQQRVCIARALANDPDYILADEPTGNLDEENEKNILEILKSLSCSGKCVIVVTHNKVVLDYADETLTLKNGKLVSSDEL